MYPILLHIYGPIKLHSFSVMLALGIWVFLHFASQAIEKKQLMCPEEFKNASIKATIIALLGARFLHILSEWNSYTNFMQVLSVWNGGLSLLGGLISLILYAGWYLKKHHLPTAQILDIVTLYAPLVHAISRIGCFLAGCCYGKQTTVTWAIQYTHPEVMAPLYTYIHPTQLYSAGAFLLLFCLLYYLQKKNLLQAGQYAMLYLLLTAIERFGLDLLRDDRITMSAFDPLSLHQAIALGLGALSFIGFLYFGLKPYFSNVRTHEPI